MNTLADSVGLLDYFFNVPTDIIEKATQHMTTEELTAAAQAIKPHLEALSNAEQITETLKKIAVATKVPLKHLYWFIRLAITGRNTGANMHELIAIVGSPEATKRVQNLLNQLT